MKPKFYIECKQDVENIEISDFNKSDKIEIKGITINDKPTTLKFSPRKDGFDLYIQQEKQDGIYETHIYCIDGELYFSYFYKDNIVFDEDSYSYSGFYMLPKNIDVILGNNFSKSLKRLKLPLK